MAVNNVPVGTKTVGLTPVGMNRDRVSHLWEQRQSLTPVGMNKQRQSHTCRNRDRVSHL